MGKQKEEPDAAYCSEISSIKFVAGASRMFW